VAAAAVVVAATVAVTALPRPAANRDPARIRRRSTRG